MILISKKKISFLNTNIKNGNKKKLADFFFCTKIRKCSTYNISKIKETNVDKEKEEKEEKDEEEETSINKRAEKEVKTEDSTAKKIFRKRFLVTTPLYYGNDMPHIGHAYCNVLGDVIRKFEKLKVNDNKEKKKHLLFSGMDEHGLKIEMKSKKLNVNSKNYIDEICEHYKKMNKELNIHVDLFYRTSGTFHKKFVQSVWSYLLKNNFIYKGVYRGYYDVNEERYLTSVELCKRQNKKEESNEKKGEENIIYIEEPNSYFFNVLKFKPFLINFYEVNKNFLYPTYLRKEIMHVINTDLRDICISRYNTKWGIKIPKEDKGTIYVWFDALLSYVSAVLYYQKKQSGHTNLDTFISKKDGEEDIIESDFIYEDFLEMLKQNKESNKIEEEITNNRIHIKREMNLIHQIWSPDVQIIGKDILKFHSILYVCLLKSLNLKLPEKIVCHGLITNENIKMSKSLNNVVSPFHLLKTYPSDIIRLYFIGCSNIYEDKNYSEQNIKSFELFLRNNVGNLLYRVISLCLANNIKIIEKIDQNAYKNSCILNECKMKKEELMELINNLEYPYFLENIIMLIKNVNRYFVHMEPWKLKMNQKGQLLNILYETLESIKYFFVFLYPIIPQLSLKVFKMLGLSIEESDISFSLLEESTPRFILNELVKLV